MKQISPQSCQPPRWAVRFFRWYCNDHLSEAVLGDFIELHARRCLSMGKRKADLLFTTNVILFCQPFAFRKESTSTHHNPTDMLQNYFKIAWRTMSRQKMYAGIKVGGFSIGLATCILIFLFIRNEVSYDKQYGAGKHIYRIYNDDRGPQGGKFTSFPANMAQTAKSDFPEIVKSGRLIPYKWFNAGSNLIRRDDRIENQYEEGFTYADQELLDILEIPMIYGNSQHSLDKPFTIVFSKKMADKYFPNEDPTGHVIILNEDKSKPYTIGGVMPDFPASSHLHYDFLLTLKGVEFWPGEQSSWCCWNYNVYLKLRPDADPVQLEKKLLGIRDRLYIGYLKETGNQSAEDVRKYHFFKLQPVRDIYLKSDGISDEIQHGDLRYVWLFGGVAVFILLLACINFINLSTAKSANRAKEVGMRKVLGSVRSYLIRQFLTESLVYSMISFVIAILLVVLIMPSFNALAGKQLSIPWSEWWFFPVLTGAALVIGVLAGMYPAFYLSAFKPAEVLKGSVSLGSKSSGMRSVMVIFQFTTSIILIIGTFIIQRQMNYILNKKIGFDKEQVLMIQGANTLNDKQATFKNELLGIAGVDLVTNNNYLPVAGTNRDQNGFWKEGKTKEDKAVGAQRWFVDEDYIPTMGMKLVEGRNFDRKMASDSQAIIINQKMAKALGLKSPIGERITTWQVFTVIGVVEDFHFESMREEIRPLAFTFGHGGSIISVKTKSKEVASVVTSVSAVWNKFMPNQPFRYTFLNESYAKMYDDVRRTGRIFASFAALAIIVACLGLFALSAFMVEQRSKEISIRLVMGASVRSIFRLLTQNFVKLVLISFVIAVPLSFYMMKKWLEDYSYKTSITMDVFLLSGLLAIVIALLTVGYQSLRAALANPANSLRSE
jgi:putative ABC transport system permease protein